MPRTARAAAGSGHVWQGRFKAFPIQQDDHLLTVLRYVERNPLRANLVKRAETWQWSSLPSRLAPQPSELLTAYPGGLPGDWRERVHRPQSQAEVAALRRSVDRGTPFGTDHWTRLAAKRLRLESTIRPRGRPRTNEKK